MKFSDNILVNLVDSYHWGWFNKFEKLFEKKVHRNSGSPLTWCDCFYRHVIGECGLDKLKERIQSEEID